MEVLHPPLGVIWHCSRAAVLLCRQAGVYTCQDEAWLSISSGDAPLHERLSTLFLPVCVCVRMLWLICKSISMGPRAAAAAAAAAANDFAVPHVNNLATNTLWNKVDLFPEYNDCISVAQRNRGKIISLLGVVSQFILWYRAGADAGGAESLCSQIKTCMCHTEPCN